MLQTDITALKFCAPLYWGLEDVSGERTPEEDGRVVARIDFSTSQFMCLFTRVVILHLNYLDLCNYKTWQTMPSSIRWFFIWATLTFGITIPGNNALVTACLRLTSIFEAQIRSWLSTPLFGYNVQSSRTWHGAHLIIVHNLPSQQTHGDSKICWNIIPVLKSESQVALESHSSRNSSRGLYRLNKIHDVCGDSDHSSKCC